MEAGSRAGVYEVRRIEATAPSGRLRADARDVSVEALRDMPGATERFTADDWRGLWACEPTEPLVDGLYAMDRNAVVWASWGAGKTTLEMDMGLHLALCRPWRGCAVTGGHVWYVFAEGQAFIAERLKALCRRYSLDGVPPRFHTISVDVPNLLKPDEAALLAARIRAQTPAGQRIVRVFLDTLAQTSPGNREDNTDMSAYVAAMTTIRQQLPDDRPHIRAAHHPGWSGDHSRGGSSLPGGIDTEVKITQNGGGLCVVECSKQ